MCLKCAFWVAPWLFNKVRANSERLPVSVGEKSEREVFRLGGGWLFSSPKSQHTAKGRGGLLHCALAADISGENEARDVFCVKFARLPKVTTEAALEKNP